MFKPASILKKPLDGTQSDHDQQDRRRCRARARMKLDLFIELGASEDQADFPWSAQAMPKAGLTANSGLTYTIIWRHPLFLRLGDPDAPLQLRHHVWLWRLSWSDFAIGRACGTIAAKSVREADGTILPESVRYLFKGLNKIEIDG
jgi:hypothetical protein